MGDGKRASWLCSCFIYLAPEDIFFLRYLNPIKWMPYGAVTYYHALKLVQDINNKYKNLIAYS